MKIFFLSPKMPAKSGGGVFTATVVEQLKGLPEADVVEYYVDLACGTKRKLKGIMQGYAKGLTKDVDSEVCRAVAESGVDLVFFNFTYFGKLAKSLRKRFPELRMVTLAHDVEVILFMHECALKGLRGLAKAIGWPSLYFNEKTQISLSDRLICLNRRDGDGFRKWYRRCPDEYLPLILQDRFNGASAYCQDAAASQPYALFVGSHFPPNVYAMRWWAANVAPHVKTKLKVVGFGFESLRNELEQAPNMEVVGAVEDLSDFYRKALFVVSPIFHGSGMKTKTAEALMHGKYLLASDEALTGYEMPFPECGRRCNTADEFIAAVRELELRPVPRFVEHSRNVYLEKYSPHVMKAILGKVLAT